MCSMLVKQALTSPRRSHLLELFLIARLFKVAGGPEDLRAVDARPLQHLAHELRLVAVHADGLEVAAVDGHGLQQGLEGGRAAVGQIAPGNGGRDPLAGIGEVGGAGEEDGVHLPLGLEGGGHLPRLLVKFRAVVDKLHVRQIPLGYIFNNVDRDRRANHANFHRNNSPFRRLKTQKPILDIILRLLKTLVKCYFKQINYHCKRSIGRENDEK